jgi:large subunit ribosomal protein L31e
MATKETKVERIYVIPLRKEWLKAPKHKRAKKAVRAVREFLAQHMRVEMEKVKIGKWLNVLLWERGIRKPVAKVKVKVTKEDGIVWAEVAELSEYAKKIEAKEKAKESKSKKEEKKEEKEKEEEKKIEETAKEELKEEDKEKKEEEKIMQKEAKPEEKAHVPKDAHMKEKVKPFRQVMKK